MEIASTNGSCWAVELLICGQYATVDVLIDKVVWNHHYANDALICQAKYLLTVATILNTSQWFLPRDAMHPRY